MTADGFPSMKARALLRLLYSLGYEVTRRSGSHRRLKCDGRPSITFAAHDRVELAPGLVRSILVNQAGLTIEEALEVIDNG